MKIGIVTTWLERGAAYVSRAYYDALSSEGNDVYIYARGGEEYAKNSKKWDKSFVTWGKKLPRFEINDKHFFLWINSNNIDVLLFNEQKHFRIVAETKKAYPNIKIGAYVDYYTEKTLKWFNMYDFLFCNTHRHIEAMDMHPQSFYIKWGVDVDLYKPADRHENSSEVIFFHSVGMSPRKGTDILIRAFIDGELYHKSKLIIHTQIPITKVSDFDDNDLDNYNIQVIHKTVTAPGLYHMGDVYVYPTKLDGLGLTMYESLASGLPVITTDYPPMNEVIDSSVGKLVKVRRNYCRNDAYYWPLSEVDKNDLILKMRYYVDHPDKLEIEKKNAREKAVSEYDWKSRSHYINKIINEAKCHALDVKLYNEIIGFYKQRKYEWLYDLAMEYRLFYKIYRIIHSRKMR